ncbi:MAG: outer membrane protein assembly factor BamA [Planctomycetota bacterium]|jgi:outer membrane protein insertion porin family
MKKFYVITSVSIILLGLCVSGCASPEAKETARIPGRYIVKSVNLEFVDKRTFKEKRLLRVLGFKKDDHVDPILADFGRENLEEFYRKRGFAFVEVKLEEKELSESEATYEYKITEGLRIKIGSVKFRGNKEIKTAKLKKAIKINKKKWSLWPRYYAEEELSDDMKRLKDVCWNRGLLNHRITVDPNILDPETLALVITAKKPKKGKSKVNITFVIDEGPVYTVKKIILTGGDKIYTIDINGDFDEGSLRAKLKLKEGQIYREQKASLDAKWLLNLYREHGFVDAEVRLLSPEFVPSTNAVNVEFEIAERDQFRIGRIDIFGNKETQDKVVRRVLDSYDFQPGKWYNAAVAPKEGGGKLEEEIRRTALCEEASITPLVSDVPGRKDVEVNIKEGKTGQWVLNAGVSSDMGLLGGLIWEQRNFDISDRPKSFSELITGEAFKGAGQSLRIALMPGTEYSRYSVSFTEPYWRDQPISLDVVGSDNEWERESYEEGRTKGYIGFGERFEWRAREQWQKSIGFRVENVDMDGIDYDAPKEIKDVKGNNSLMGVKVGIGKDLTDDRFIPSEGYRLNSSYEQVGGEHTFGVLSGTYRQYRTIYEDLAERKTVLATRLRAATVLGDAPAFEKFYGGGMYSIRGFDYRGVSTRGTPMVGGVPLVGAKKKDPIGSDWIFLANAEVTVPLVKESLAGLLFVDSGAIDSGGYRAAVGTGIQIMIPQWFGPVPMRFEIAAPVMKDDADDTQVFSFSVGRLF